MSFVQFCFSARVKKSSSPHDLTREASCKCVNSERSQRSRICNLRFYFRTISRPQICYWFYIRKIHVKFGCCKNQVAAIFMGFLCILQSSIVSVLISGVRRRSVSWVCQVPLWLLMPSVLQRFDSLCKVLTLLRNQDCYKSILFCTSLGWHLLGDMLDPGVLHQSTPTVCLSGASVTRSKHLAIFLGEVFPKIMLASLKALSVNFIKRRLYTYLWFSGDFCQVPYILT